jgi:hypothetical protein
MTSAEYRIKVQPLRRGRARTERDFQDDVVKMARALGWSLIHHETDSRKSAAGWLDLTMYRGNVPGRQGHWTSNPRMIFAELKVGKRKVTPEQQAWAWAHGCLGHEVYVWRESAETWREIEDVLR